MPPREPAPILRAHALVPMSIRPVSLAISTVEQAPGRAAAEVPCGFIHPFFTAPRPEHENFESFL